MTRGLRVALLALSTALGATACGNASSSPQTGPVDGARLAGAWRSKMVFRSGPLAAMKDLEFLYAYNAGGTMTESSNYDEAANSSPPAYGVWKQTSPRTFSTKYVFYTTKAPDPAAAQPGGGDWWPDGHGVLTETIALADDGQTYTSTVTLALFDAADAPIAGGGEGTGAGTRIGF